MKFMLMFIQSSQEDDATGPQDAPDHDAVGKWWGEHAAAGRVLEGHGLQDVRTATTIHKQQGKILITDGPFMEAKESIGGYGIIEVPDLDAAIALASSMPLPNLKLELRPLSLDGG